MLKPDDVKVSGGKKTGEKNSALITVSPLPTGFGTTLGNSLRRIMLSSLPGFALSQVKFSSVSHEFSTIKGVKEDVLDITLNLKKVRLKLFSDNPVVVKLSVSGSKKIKASDLDLGGEGEVINGDLHIATLSGKTSKLEAEMVAESGVGYVQASERESSKVGVILLDSLFSPVTLVSFVVEPTRVGKETNLDKLIMDVTTDGSVTPMEAIIAASNLLGDFFIRIGTGKKLMKPESKAVKKKIEEPVYLEELNLPTRTVNALKKAGIKTLQDLSARSKEDIAKIRNLGEKSLTQIGAILDKK